MFSGVGFFSFFSLPFRSVAPPRGESPLTHIPFPDRKLARPGLVPGESVLEGGGDITKT